MNKKILIVCILAVFTLVAISFASAINTTTPVKKKESPLYGIRTRRAIGERLGEIIDYIKTRFLGDRIFFLPFQWIRDRIDDYQQPYTKGSTCSGPGVKCTIYQWTCPTECPQNC